MKFVQDIDQVGLASFWQRELVDKCLIPRSQVFALVMSNIQPRRHVHMNSSSKSD